MIFKCNRQYIKERLFLFTVPNKLENSQKSNDLKKDPLKEEFVKMMQDVDPLFPSDKNKLKKNEEDENKIQIDLVEAEYAEQINEYTDTLTTWVF